MHYLSFRGRKAFTLIELLVVVSVLVLIASIVLVNLRGAREGAVISNALVFQSQVHRLLGVDLVGWWNFETIEPGNIVLDDSGSGNNGTVHGATLVGGLRQRGNALRFDGVDDFVQFPSLTGKSISMWVFISSSQGSGWRYLLDARDGTANSWYTSHGIGSFWAVQHVNGVRTSVSWAAIPIDTWVHLYLQGSSNFTDNINLMSRFTNNENLNGTIDDVRIYNRALTSQEVKDLYVQTKGKYLVGE